MHLFVSESSRVRPSVLEAEGAPFVPSDHGRVTGLMVARPGGAGGPILRRLKAVQSTLFGAWRIFVILSPRPLLIVTTQYGGTGVRQARSRRWVTATARRVTASGVHQRQPANPRRPRGGFARNGGGWIGGGLGEGFKRERRGGKGLSSTVTL